MQGLICLWSGSIVSIPAGWALCNGSNGTPDLRDCFLVGAGSTYAVGATGGANTHTHTFTANAHNHALVAGAFVAAGLLFGSTTNNVAVTGTTDSEDNRPPYFALAYIMKL